MIVCECTGTTDSTIRALAREGATKVSDVTKRCGAGGCCQSCKPLIARLLRREAASAESALRAADVAAVEQVPAA